MVRLFILLAALALASAAQARDPDGRYANAPFHQWFKSQYNSVGQWCCDSADGHFFDGSYTFDKDGAVNLTVEGQAVTVLPTQVLKSPNPTGHAVIWYRTHEYGLTVYCFSPGSMG